MGTRFELLACLGISVLGVLPGCPEAPKPEATDGGPTQAIVPPMGCLVLTRSSVDFGNVLVNTTRTDWLAVTNRCGRDVDLRIGPLIGADPLLFGTTPASGSVITLQDLETTSVTVQYSPSIPSPKPNEASFFVSLCERGARCDVAVSLRGTAVATGASLDPSPLNFCFVPTGQSLTLSLMLSNAANVPIHLTADPRVINDTPSGPSPDGPFQPSAGFPTKDLALFAGQSVQFPITFTPPGSGQFTGELDISTDDATSSNLVVSLNGYGGGAKIACTPLALDFGLTAIGTNATLKVTCTNVGTSVPEHPEANLFIPGPHSDRLGLSTENGSDVFRPGFDPPLPAGMLLPGESATIDVTYVPSTAGADADTLIVSSNDCTNPQAPIALTASAVVLPACDFKISPTGGLAFGDVGAGTKATLTFAITNIGATDCLVNAIQIAPDSNPAFSLPDYPPASGTASTTIPAGGWLEVRVQFAPTSAQPAFSGSVSFAISNPMTQHQSVALTGSSLAGCLRIDPNPMVFGFVGWDPTGGSWCKSKKRTVTLRNLCLDQDVTVNRISVLDLDTNGGAPQPEFILWGDPSPVTIARACPANTYCPPTSPVTFQISFEPYAIGKRFGGIQIDAPDSFVHEPYLVSLVGNASTDSTQSDHFVGQSPELDLLWVVDTDDEATAEQQVIAGLPSFLTYPMQNHIDLHMATTSTDLYGSAQSEDGRMEPCPGCKINGSPAHVVTLAGGLDDTVATLGRLLNLGGGASCLSDCNGLNPEDLFLETVFEAFSPTMLNEYNQAFYRPEASLAVIVIGGDCDDDDSPQGLDAYSRAFTALKGAGRASQFSLSYVAQGCGFGGNQKMQQMVQLTGGVEADLSNTGTPNWTDELNALWPQLASQLLAYKLSGTPVLTPLTVTVTLNGLPIPQLEDGLPQWSYDGRANAVVFTPLVAPVTGDQLDISYTLACSQ